MNAQYTTTIVFDKDGFAKSKQILPKYQPTLADLMGMERVTFDFSEVDPAKLEMALDRMIQGVNGYRVVGAANSTKSGRLYAYKSKADQLWLKRMFPAVKDAIRSTVIETPLEQAMTLLKATIHIVPDDNVEAQTADGQGTIDIPAQLAADSKWREGDQLQVRAVIITDGNVRKMVIKGQLIVRILPDLVLASGETVSQTPVLNLAKSMVKGSEIGQDQQFASVLLGVVSVGEIRKMKIGYQVAQFWPKSVWTKFEEYQPQIWPQIAEEVRNPETFIRNSKPEGFMKVLHQIAEFDASHGTSLLKHRGIARMLAMEVSGHYANWACGGLRVPSFAAAASPLVPEGEIWMRRDVFERAGMACKDVLLIRMPHDGAIGKAKIRFVSRTKAERMNVVMPKNGILVHPTYFGATALDFDMDYVALVEESLTPWTTEWFYSVEHTQMSAKKRAQSANKSETLAQRIIAIKEASIGLIANTISDAKAWEWKTGGVFNPEWMHQLVDAQQAAVDAAKHGSAPDMEFVRDMRKWMKDNGLNKADSAFRPFLNGRFHTHTKATENITLVKDVIWKRGELVMPSRLGSPTTPLGRALAQIEEHLPAIELETLDNRVFLDWLPDGVGESAKQAETIYRQFCALMASAQYAEESDQERHHACEYLRSALNDLQDKTEAAKRIWTLSMTSEKAYGYAVWFGLWETTLELLSARGEALNAHRKIATGRIIWSGFKDYAKTGYVKVECITMKSKSGVSRLGFKLHDGREVITDQAPDTLTGTHFLTVKAGESASQWVWTLEPRTIDQNNTLEDLKAKEAKLVEDDLAIAVEKRNPVFNPVKYFATRGNMSSEGGFGEFGGNHVMTDEEAWASIGM